MPLSSSKRRTLLAGGILLVAFASWGGSHWIGKRFETALTKGLAKRNLGLSWKSSSWSPWNGLELRGLHLHSLRAPEIAIAEWDHLNLSVRFDQLAAGKDREMDWHMRDSALTLHDNNGPIHLHDVSLHLEASAAQLRIARLQARHRGLVARLKGAIALDSESTPHPPHFQPDFSVVRGVLSALDVAEGSGPFEVTGNFDVISNKEAGPQWSARLDGKGNSLEWKGVRWSSAAASARLGNRDSVIHYDLHSARGFTRGNLRRADWTDSRFLFEGELGDSLESLNTYSGSYGKSRLVLTHMKGDANLILLAEDIPAFAGSIPESLEIQDFPTMEIRQLVKDPSTLTIESATLRSDDKMTVIHRTRRIPIENLSVSTLCKNSEWTVDEASANLMGGSLTASGKVRNGILHDSRIRIRGIRLSEIKSMPENHPGIFGADYEGRIDFSQKLAEGSGSMHMENAPVIEVPLLDQVYDLFMAMIPGVNRSGEGRFEADFKARGDKVEVPRFEATGGTLTVSAVGQVDLTQGRVAGRARGKLTGLPGLVTSPLSRLLEMDVAGPYDNIRVKPLGPAKLASNTVSGVVGTVVDTIEEAGKITGTVLTEGVKLPFRLLEGAPPPGEQKKRPAGKK